MAAPQDQATFMANLMGNWQGTVQYNDEGGNPITIGSRPFIVGYLCNMMNNASNTNYTNYVNVARLFLKLVKTQMTPSRTKPAWM